MTNSLLQFFSYNHLPERLQVISKPFHDMAKELNAILPTNPETTVAFRKLLEAKDCAVRAVLFKWDTELPKALQSEEKSNEQ
mgnify:FL=1